MFLKEWIVLAEESRSRENSGRSAKDLTIGEEDLALVPNPIMAHGLTTRNLSIALGEIKRRAVMNALQETGGDKSAASRLLHIGRATLYRRLKE